MPSPPSGADARTGARADAGPDAGAGAAFAPSPARPDVVAVGQGLPHDTLTPDVETASDRYAEQRFGGAHGAWLLQQQDEAIDRLLDALGAGPLHVLDVGGGHGQVAPLLLRRGASVVVHGSRPVCFARLASQVEAHAGRLALCASSLWRLPFAARTFDLVTAVRLLGHVAQWRELVGEMARVSARYLMIEFARGSHPLLPWLGTPLFALKRRFEGTTRPFFSYREEAVVSALGQHGFRVIARGAQFALPMVVHRMLRDPALSQRLEQGLRRLGAGEGARSPVVLLAERR